VKEVANVPDAVAGQTNTTQFATDKRGYGARVGFSPRMIDKLLAAGMPHLKIGERRVRIIIADADAWLRDQYSTRRRKAIKPVEGQAA
jgi:hypothetical protein